MGNPGKIKRIFDLYMSDLSYEEIERLIKKESSDIYDFFSKELPKPDKSKSKPARILILLRNLFNVFLLKLTPARRLFYLAALLLLVIGFTQNAGEYIIISFVIMNLLLAFELADKLLMKNELEVAQKIQAELVPKVPPVLAGYDVAFHYESAKEVGGDYLDFITAPNSSSLFVVIGDVSGKGIAAALYVVRVQAIIHQLMENFTSLKEMVADIKKYFSHNLRKEFFLTLEICEIKNDNTLNFCRAGHNPAYFYSSNNKEIVEIRPKGLAIGFNDKINFEKSLEEIALTSGPDDIIFLYTDGVSETMNYNKMLFGEERIKTLIKTNASKSAEEIKDIMLWNIFGFKGSEPLYDDLAFIVLKRKN